MSEPTSLTGLLSHLGSIFAAEIVAVYVIFWPCLSLRLIAIGFDLRFFHAVIDHGGAMDCHRRSTGLQEDEPRQADTTTRVIRIRINRF